jgi:ribonuclease G
MGKGTIKSSFLFTDVLEEKIDQLVSKLGIKAFTLHVHPYVYAYINQGFISLKRRWQMKYGFGVRIIPNHRLALLQYEFISPDGEEIDMKSEDDMK